MPLLITAFAFVALTAAISVFGYRWYVRPSRYMEQVGAVSAPPVVMPMLDKLSNRDEHGLVVRIIQHIGARVPVSPADASVAQLDLLAAGYRSPGAIPVLYGCKVLAAAGMVLLAIAFRDMLPESLVLRNVLLVGAGFIGYMAPSFGLDFLIDARRDRIRYGLPDALDLMIVAVEAGLGLDQAIQYISRELAIAHKDVCEELALVTLEMQAGKRRSEALRNLADRTGEPELKKLVAVLIQTDKFGTSVADSLRTHSDFMRVHRKQEAQERANKVGVKLVFPIFFFILPAMMIVAAGPGLLQVFKYLFPMMRTVH